MARNLRIIKTRTKIDVNFDTTEMLDVAWELLAKHFTPAEVNIKQELVDKYWKN